MEIQTIKQWLWVLNPIWVDFGQQIQGTLQNATIQIWQDSTKLAEGFFVAKDDVLRCDISGYARELFDLIPNDTTANPGNSPAETYKVVTLRIYVNDNDELIYEQQHVLVYGGRDPLEGIELMEDFATANVGTTRVNFMTEFERPKIWASKPFELRLCKDGDLEVLQESVSVTAYDRLENYVDAWTVIMGSNGSGPDILKVRPLDESGYTDNAAITHFKIGEGQWFIEDIWCDLIREYFSDAVYLRWINRYGGVDQYLFELHDYKNPVRTTSVPRPKDYEYALNYNRGSNRIVDKDVQQQLTIGVTHVPNSEYRALASIARSRRVDMYMGAGKWVQVLLADTDFNLANENDYQDCELTITVL